MLFEMHVSISCFETGNFVFCLEGVSLCYKCGLVYGNPWVLENILIVIKKTNTMAYRRFGGKVIVGYIK